MKKMNHSASKAGLVGAMMLCLTGCVVYREGPATRTVYVPTPAPPAAAPVVEVRAESDFYDPLQPYGEWVVVGSFGRCWRPTHVEVGWRPYTSGNWRRCDAGWYWASEEPWGWATYHYGRWDWHRQYGWIWVPQTQWAPAWVTWRAGAGYVGWAPMPPTARITVSGTVDVGDVLIESRFVFVEERRMTHPIHPRTVIINDRTVINKTVNITKIKMVNRVVVNEGPRVDVIERASGRKIEAQSVHNLRRQEESDFVARKQKQAERTADNRRSPTPPRVEPSTPPTAMSPRDNRGPDKSNDEPMRPRPAAPGKPQERSEPTPVVVPVRPRPESPTPVAGTPARDNRATDNAGNQQKKPRPSVPEQPQVRNEPAPIAESSRPGRGQPAHNVKKSEPMPVAARTLPDPKPTPAVVPTTPAPVEKPVVAARETPPGQAKNSGNEPGRPTAGPANSNRQAAQADKPGEKVTEKPTRSPKDNGKPPASEQGQSNGRGRQNKNGDKEDQK